MTPPLTAVNALFLQLMNKSLSQEVFVTLLQPQNASIIYPFCFFLRPKNDSFPLPFTVLLLEKFPIHSYTRSLKKNSPLGRKPWNFPIEAIIGNNPTIGCLTFALNKSWVQSYLRHRNSRIQKLLGEWVQVLGKTISGIFWVNVS